MLFTTGDLKALKQALQLQLLRNDAGAQLALELIGVIEDRDAEIAELGTYCENLDNEKCDLELRVEGLENDLEEAEEELTLALSSGSGK